MTSHSSLSSLLVELRSTWRDNPLIEKDAGLLLRKGSYVAMLSVLAVALLGIFALAVLSAETTSHDILFWSTPRLFGSVGVTTVVVVLAVVSSVVFPILASATIAGEKERGTFPLLVTSALTPGQIVVGKFAALLISVAPVFFLAAPLLGLSAFGGEVTPFSALLFMAYLAVGSVLQISVGLWTSSLVDRVRFAGPLAIGASGVLVWPIFTFPLFGGVAAWNESAGFVIMAPAMVFVALASLALSAVCLLATRSRLAPVALPRAKARAAATTVIQVLLPVFAAASFGLFQWTRPGDTRDFLEVYAHILPLLYGLVLFLSVILDVAHAAHQREELSDAPSPRRAVLMTGARIGAGLALAIPILQIVLSPLTLDTRFSDTLAGLTFGLVASAVILTLGYMALASVVVLIGRLLRQPLLKMVTGAGLVLMALIFPFCIAIGSEILTGSEWFPLLWMNPLHQITQATAFDFWDASQLSRATFFGLNAVIPGVALYLGVTAVAVLTGRQRPLMPVYRR